MLISAPPVIPKEGEEDITNDDFDDADNAENSFEKAFKPFESILEGGSSAAAAGDIAIGLFSGIIIAIHSILAIFGIGSSIYKEKKRKAAEHRDTIEEEVKKSMKNEKRIGYWSVTFSKIYCTR